MKEIIKTDKAPGAIGPYSQGIALENLVFTSGQIPINPADGSLVERDITLQTKMAMDNLQAVLIAGGSSMGDIIKTTCYLDDMADFAAFNAVYETYFSSDFPARSCFSVKGLPKGALCEIEAIAIRN